MDSGRVVNQFVELYVSPNYCSAQSPRPARFSRNADGKCYSPKKLIPRTRHVCNSLPNALGYRAKRGTAVRTQFWLILTFVLFLPGVAHSQCTDPYNPTIERSEMTTTLHVYAEDSELCIIDPKQNCDGCVSGFEHECKDGSWQPLKHLACSGDRVADGRDAQSKIDQGASDSAPGIQSTDTLRLLPGQSNIDAFEYAAGVFTSCGHPDTAEGVRNWCNCNSAEAFKSKIDDAYEAWVFELGPMNPDSDMARDQVSFWTCVNNQYYPIN